jgi:phosphate/sulfate permease
VLTALRRLTKTVMAVAVRWNATKNIVIAWTITMPMPALIGAGAYRRSAI